MATVFKLGKLALKSSAILSPLESVSDVGFRSLCGSLGAGLVWTEMIRAQAVCKNNKSALDLIDTFDGDHTPVGIQLLVKTPADLLNSLKHLEALSQTVERSHYKNISAVDLNFGCPSPSIIREGAGPALLKRRQRMRDLFTALAEWRENTTLNVGAIGCKIRLGLNQAEVDNKVYLEVAKIASECTLDYITVHARHAAQRSSQPPMWGAITEVKEMLAATNTKVIGNGSVFTVSDAIALKSLTKCDAVMIARGAIKNPWVFQSYLNLGESNSNTTDPPAEYLPTKLDIDSAVAQYKFWNTNVMTKSKFTEFHFRNFERLKLESSTGGKACRSVEYPKNQHML